MTVILRRLTAKEWSARLTEEDHRLDYMRRYAKAHPEKVAATRLRWQTANPDAARAVYRAHRAVWRAVKRGLLIRPDLCSRCDLPGRRIEAAHHDYTKPMEVTWLCPTCHRLEDHARPKTRVQLP